MDEDEDVDEDEDGVEPADETLFEVQVPPELDLGVYSNFLGVWHTPYEFTLDFAQTLPPQPAEGDESAVVMPCRVVARIKIPVALIFNLMQALNENMTRYEAAYGVIRRPEEAAGEDEDEPEPEL